MPRSAVIVANSSLGLWFGLDMVGVSLGEHVLVSRAWREDGVFFIAFLLAFLAFVAYERLGKPVLTVFLALWLVTQLLSHEVLTIVGGGEGKKEFFAHTIKLFDSATRYVPDLYHLVLHILIGCALVCTVRYRRDASRRDVSQGDLSQ